MLEKFKAALMHIFISTMNEKTQFYGVFQRLSAHYFGVVHSHCFHRPCLQPQQAAVFNKRALINPLYHSCQQTDRLAGEHS